MTSESQIQASRVFYRFRAMDVALKDVPQVTKYGSWVSKAVP